MEAGDLQLQRITILVLTLQIPFQLDGPYTVPWDKTSQVKISPKITLDFLLMMLKITMEQALDLTLISSLLLFTSGPELYQASTDIKQEQECSELPRQSSTLGLNHLFQVRLTFLASELDISLQQ
jgi:hypothetical protein